MDVHAEDLLYDDYAALRPPRRLRKVCGHIETVVGDEVCRRAHGADHTDGPAGVPDRACRYGVRVSRTAAISFDDRMETVDFRVSHTAHIVVDSDICRSCTTQACVSACPAKLFVTTNDGGILFNYEQCFECGTCYMICNHEGAISWSYPEGGHGVVFRHG